MLSSGTSGESQISGTDLAVGGSAYSMTWLHLVYFATGILWTGAIAWVTAKLTRMLSNTVGCHIQMPAINICVNPIVSLRNSYNNFRRSFDRIRSGRVAEVLKTLSRGAHLYLWVRIHWWCLPFAFNVAGQTFIIWLGTTPTISLNPRESLLPGRVPTLHHYHCRSASASLTFWEAWRVAIFSFMICLLLPLPHMTGLSTQGNGC